MGSLTMTLDDGRTGTLNVDNGFASMKPEDQQAMVDHLKDQLNGHAGFGSDVVAGVHDLGTAAQQGLHAVGGVMSRNNVPGADYVNQAGDFIAQHTPDAPVGNNPSGQLANDFSTGNYSAMPGHALHAAVRSSLSALPIIGAGMVGGPAAAAGAAGAMSLGPIAQERAANNGRSETNTADVIGAFPGAVASAVGGSLIPGGSNFSSAIGRGLFRAGSDAAGSASMNAAGCVSRM